MKIFKKIVDFFDFCDKVICTFIWEFAEFFNISLGKLAPWIFGKMIGAKGMKKIK